jgi:heat shock protein HslJ
MYRQDGVLRIGLALLAALALVGCGRSDTGSQQDGPAGGPSQGGAEEWRTALAGAGAPLSPIPPEAALAGTAWRLEQLRGHPPVAGTDVTLTFTDLQMSGQVCNYFGGPYAIDGGGLFRGANIAQTLMACTPNEVMRQEDDFMQALRASTHYRRGGDRLALLTAAGEELLVFRPTGPGLPNRAEPLPQPPEQQLTTSTWLQMEPGSYSPLPGGAALRFSGGQLELHVGCLRLSGPYETSGWRIRLLHQYSAEQLCTPGPDEPAQIRVFLERLGRARFFWPSQGTLALETPDGEALAFVAQGEGVPAPAAAPLAPGRTLIDPTPVPRTPVPTPGLPTPTPPEATATATPILESYTPTPADTSGPTPSATPGLVQSAPGGPGAPAGAPGSSGPSLPIVTTGPSPTPAVTATPASG